MSPKTCSILLPCLVATALHAPEVRPHFHATDAAYKADCWRQSPAWPRMTSAHRRQGTAFLTEHKSKHRSKPEEAEEEGLFDGARPGAGMAPDDIVPFETVQRDGFFEIGCFKEYLYNHGDKFGANRQSYEYEEMGNSSIVHYSDVVPKEDRELMTHEVCFRFCRTVPGMYNFGIVNGRDCYCAPFVKRIAGDSADCDASCQGDGGSLCGSKSKSLIFEMHWCGTSGEKLFEAGDLGAATVRLITASKMDVQEAGSDKLQIAGQHLQEVFGKAGDVDADKLMQKVKVFAGKLHKAVGKGAKNKDKLADLVLDADDYKGKEFSDSDTITAAEDLTKELQTATEDTTDKLRKAAELFRMTQRGKEQEDLAAGKQYMSLMSFVDKEHSHLMSTCSGDTEGAPIFETTPDSCAAACDDDRDCVGFSFYDVDNVGSICFLVHKFKTVTYYTKCYEEDEDKGGKFLQKSAPRASSPPASARFKLESAVSELHARKAARAARHNHTSDAFAAPREIAGPEFTRALVERQAAMGGKGCRCDEEKYLGLCLKKCALLTEGQFSMRSGVNSCCRSQPCEKAGNTHTDGFGLCEGYGRSGDGECGAVASIKRAGQGTCEENVPEQVEPADVELAKPAEGVDPTAAQIVAEFAESDVLEGILGVGKAADEPIEDDGPGLVMCFAKFSEFGGTKPKIKAKKADRCYK